MTDRKELADECERRSEDARIAEDYLAALRPDDAGEPLSAFLKRVASALRATPHIGDECADMLWKWFEERGAIGHEEARNGLTASDFKVMLDEHEAALTAPPGAEWNAAIEAAAVAAEAVRGKRLPVQDAGTGEVTEEWCEPTHRYYAKVIRALKRTHIGGL